MPFLSLFSITEGQCLVSSLCTRTLNHEVFSYANSLYFSKVKTDSMLFYMVVYYLVLYIITFYFVVIYYSVLHCVMLYCIVLYYTLRYIFIVLLCIILDYITFCYHLCYVILHCPDHGMFCFLFLFVFIPVGKVILHYTLLNYILMC